MDDPHTDDPAPEAAVLPAGNGVAPADSLPDNHPHEGGSPVLDGDAQYGASPIRTARYDENHEANADIAQGKVRSGHHGAQARYATPQDIAGNGPTGHDEQQQSRDLAKNGR